MANETEEQAKSGSPWKAQQVYGLAAVCLLVGVLIGYLFRGSQSPAPPPQTVASVPASVPASATAGHMPSLDEMKQMADKKAESLLEKLKSDPQNKDLLIQAGNVYEAAHQFKEAIGYYDKALQVDPKNTAIRTEMASCMYYNGDADGAISQLEQGLHYDPKDANSLFNLGMIKWQGKQDSKGALAAWEQLLKSNPQLGADRKATVQKLMAEVQTKGKS